MSVKRKRVSLAPKKPLRRFDFQLVQAKLQGLLFNVDRDLQRRVNLAAAQRDSTREAQLVTFSLLVRFAKNSFYAAGYLVADSPEDSKREPNYVLVLPSVNRQLLDLLFSLVYMLDDLPARMIAYGKSGWRELLEQHGRYKGRFSTDPEWKEFFANWKHMNSDLIRRFGITEQERRDPSLVPYWFTPSKLKERRSASSPFLRWLYNWFYQDTSEQAHLSSSGLFMVAPMLLAEIVGGVEQDVVNMYVRKMYHYVQFSRTAIVTLAIMTEVDNYWGLGNKEAIAYLWAMFTEHSPEAKDMFDQRYEKLGQKARAQAATSLP